MKHIAVIDIGKTNAKLALVDLDSLSEICVLTRENRVLAAPPYPHFDAAGIWAFIKQGLRQFQADFGISGISITTHGATAALLTRDGLLAAPILDYEHTEIDQSRAEYNAIRPDFLDTGSPDLPMGLNLGAQLFWQLRTMPDLAQRIDCVVTYPQYWGYLLTGRRACDVTSLGCHTDLWVPAQNRFSDLPARLGLADKFAPCLSPADILGPLLPQLQSELGLGAVPVVCGIHDSNASLLPHLLGRAAPFSVVSTGTWVISMAVGGDPVSLDPKQDTLINVNALGAPVPSARFMGGRIHDQITQGHVGHATQQDADQVRETKLRLIQTADGDLVWSHPPPNPAQRQVALGYYLGERTAKCLSMIGAKGPTLVEGPFAANPWFLAMLASATQRIVHPSASRTGTAIGAAMLFRKTPIAANQPVILPDPTLIDYARLSQS